MLCSRENHFVSLSVEWEFGSRTVEVEIFCLACWITDESHPNLTKTTPVVELDCLSESGEQDLTLHAWMRKNNLSTCVDQWGEDKECLPTITLCAIPYKQHHFYFQINVIFFALFLFKSNFIFNS